MRRAGPRPQQGAAIVEFAIVAMLFFTLLVGIVEMGRALFIWNSAAEATRRGVRMAVVTAPYAAAIRNEMRLIMPDLANNQISIAYLPDGCTVVANCNYVTVGVVAYTVTPLVIPIGPLALPPFSTTLTRESLGAS